MILEKIKIQLRDKSKRNFIIYGIGQSFNLLSPLAITPFITAKCGEDGLGKVGLGFALALFLILIVDYAFEVKGVKQIAENTTNKTQLSQIFSLGMTSKLCLFVVAFLFSIFLIKSFDFFGRESLLFLLSLSIVFAQVFNPIWVLQGLQDFLMVSIINILSKSFYVITVLVLINTKSDYVFVNLYLGLTALFFNLIGLFYLIKKHKLTYVLPKQKEIIAVIKKDFTFCISQLVLSIRQISPLMLTSYFLGYTVGGQYRIIEQFITLFRTFIQVFLRYFYPGLCLKYATSVVKGIQHWKRVLFYNSLIVTSLVLVILLFSKQILLYFNIEKSTLEPLNNLLMLALLIPLLMSFSLPLEQITLVSGNNKYYIRTTFVVTLINLALIYFSIYSFKLYGVISALIVAELLFIFLYYSYFKKIKHQSI
jgi:O-antigen/teichoic acid export membrane protein